MSLSSQAAAEFKDAVIRDSLRRCSLFSELDQQELAQVAAACRLQTLAKGAYLFREGELAHGFYVVKSGAINVHRVTPEGREQVIRIFRPPESFAEITLVTIETYPADAVALEPSQVILVGKNAFRELVRNQPDLALRMLSSMSFHLKHLVQLLEDLKFKQVEARLAHWLVRQCPVLSRGEPPVVVLGISKKVLAGQLGVASETLSRTLARFRDEGLIRVDGRRITLLDTDGLNRQAVAAAGVAAAGAAAND
jgi:CRP/FNR family transcriptional regulator